jgi:hypothetical protein
MITKSAMITIANLIQQIRKRQALIAQTVNDSSVCGMRHCSLNLVIPIIILFMQL